METTASEWPFLRTLVVLLSGRCNLDCAYCYRGGGGGGRDLAEAALDEALSMALRAEGPSLEVNFSGGEPMLRFDLFRRAVKRLRAEATASRPVTLRLVTNGTMLGERELDFLVAHDVALSVSVDGAPDVQRRRGPEAVTGTGQLFECLRRLYPVFLARRVRALMTVLPGSLGSLADSVDYLLDEGLAEINAAPSLVPVPGVDDDLRPLLDTQLTAVRRRCEDWLAATGVVPFLPLRRIGIEPSLLDAGAAEEDRRCAIWSGTSPVLDTDGHLYACLLFAPSGLGEDESLVPLRRVAANVDLGLPGEPGYAHRAGRLPGVLADLPGFAPQRQLTSRFGACTECDARATCHICPYALLRFAGSGDATRVATFHCAWHREIARQRRLIPAQPATGLARWLPEVIEQRRIRFLERFDSGNP